MSKIMKMTLKRALKISVDILISFVIIINVNKNFKRFTKKRDENTAILILRHKVNKARSYN